MNNEEYYFRPEETKWSRIQFYLQNLIVKVLDDDKAVGFEAEEFSARLSAYVAIFDKIEEIKDEYLVVDKRKKCS